MLQPFRARRLPRSAAAAALCLLAACGGPGPEPEGGAGAWSKGEAWTLVPEARIGAVDGDGPDVFARVVDVALDGMGRVWIADAQQHQLRVFDAGGAHVRTIGRKGGGPAEFDGIAGMDWGPDGNLWVLDGGNMRFAVYDTAGNLVTTHRRDVNIVVAPWPLGFDREGRLYDLASMSAEPDEPQKVVRFGPGLQPVDTFRIPAFEAALFEIARQDGNTRSVSRVNVPFSPRQLWRADPEGFVWVGTTDRYRLERRRFDGTVDRVVERPAPLRPVTAEDRAKALEHYRGFQQEGGRIDESRIPRTHPVLKDFFFGDDGHLWVFPEGGDSTVVDVFDAAGEYLGEVDAGQRVISSPAPVVRDGRMAAVTVDEDGVPSVVLLRIRKPAP